MDDAVTARLIICAGGALVGAGFLAVAIRARIGATPAARRWMGNEFGAFSHDERMVLLGAPAIGVLSWCTAASALPVVGRWLMVLAIPIALAAFISLGWAILSFIPIPAWVYPRWARPLRERNRRTERAMKDWLRER